MASVIRTLLSPYWGRHGKNYHTTDLDTNKIVCGISCVDQRWPPLCLLQVRRKEDEGEAENQQPPVWGGFLFRGKCDEMDDNVFVLIGKTFFFCCGASLIKVGVWLADPVGHMKSPGRFNSSSMPIWSLVHKYMGIFFKNTFFTLWFKNDSFTHQHCKHMIVDDKGTPKQEVAI